MHIFIVFVEFGGIGLGCKSGKSLFVDINSKRFIASDDNVNSQIKFVPIYKEWVRNITTDYAQFVYVYIVNVVNDMDTSALTRIRRLHDPNISSGV